MLEDFTNPRTSLDFRTKSADDDDDPRSAAVRARDVILNDRLERRKVRVFPGGAAIAFLFHLSGSENTANARLPARVNPRSPRIAD